MIGKQLKKLIQEENINIENFSELVEIKTKTIYSYTSDANDPKYEVLLQLKQKYKQKTGKNINLDWLISGEGTMFLNDFDEKKVTANFETLIKEAGIEVDENGYLKKRPN
jgi:predicted transcriptional regulator